MTPTPPNRKRIILSFPLDLYRRLKLSSFGRRSNTYAEAFRAAITWAVEHDEGPPVPAILPKRPKTSITRRALKPKAPRGRR